MKPSDDQPAALQPQDSEPSRLQANHQAPPNLGDARINQEAIGAKLRELFDEVVNEAVPDEFLELLRLADENAADREAGGMDESR